MTTDSKSQSKELGEGKVDIPSEEDAEKNTDKGILSEDLIWKEHFFNAMCPIASKI